MDTNAILTLGVIELVRAEIRKKYKSEFAMISRRDLEGMLDDLTHQIVKGEKKQEESDTPLADAIAALFK